MRTQLPARGTGSWGGLVEAPSPHRVPRRGPLASSQQLTGSFLPGPLAGFVSKGFPEASVTSSVPFCSASHLLKNSANASRGKKKKKKIECDTSVDPSPPQEYSLSRPSCFEVQTPVPLSRSLKWPCARLVPMPLGSIPPPPALLLTLAGGLKDAQERAALRMHSHIPEFSLSA